MTSEGRKRKRSESTDAIVSPGQLAPALSEHTEEPGRAEQVQDTEVDQAATHPEYKDLDLPTTAQAYKDIKRPTTTQDFKDADLPASAQACKDVDHPTTRQAHQDVDLSTSSPNIPSVHTRAHSTLSPIDEPTHPLIDEPHLQRRTLSPTQLSHPHPGLAERPAYKGLDQPTTAQDYKDIDPPTTPPAVTSVRTPTIPTRTVTDKPLLQRSEFSPAELSPTHVAYTDVDLPATPPVISPVHTPVRSTVPLTYANLRTIDPTMAPAGPKTPVKGSVKDSGSEASKDGDTVRAMTALLRKRSYLIEDNQARKLYEGFLDKAKDLVNGGRYSDMKPASIEAIKTIYGHARTANEATFLTHFWSELMKKTRTVRASGAEDNSQLTEMTWYSSMVMSHIDQLFRSASVAAIPETDPTIIKLLDDIPKIRIPKPDMLFGLIPEQWCSRQQIAVMDRYPEFAKPNFDLALPWFIVEGKSVEGNIEKAVVQAARAGAALVASWRGLDAIAGSQSLEDGPDRRSYVYSLCLSVRAAVISVHWAEVEKGQVVAYHMHMVTQYLLPDTQTFTNLRRDVNNILDWGADIRKQMVVGMLDSIIKQDTVEAGLEQGNDSEEDVTEEASGKGKQKAKAKLKAKGKKAASSSASTSALGERRSSSKLRNKK